MDAMPMPLNVLFVDDSQVFLEMFTQLCAIISNQAWRTECATSVDGALAVLREKPIDLVVLDLGLPMVNGFELLGLIKQLYPGLRIAVMTGDASDSARAAALAAGAEAFVEKPMTTAGIKSVFNLLNDLVCGPQPGNAAGMVPPEGLPPEHYVAAAYHGKWSSADGRSK
jgi:CheY-like chemotaxis protein